MSDEKVLRKVFAQMDTDNSGTLDVKELKAVIKVYLQSVKEDDDDKRVTEMAQVRNCSNDP